MSQFPSGAAAEHIERSLAAAVLRGEHAPGSRLPTVRELAATFDVNAATVQRALARLERSGLVTARQGSGIRVNDPARVGDLSVLPAWIDALRDDPARAARFLEDCLEVRRIVAARLVARRRERLLEQAERLGRVAQEAAAAVDRGVDAFRDADLALAEEILAVIGNGAAVAVLHTSTRLMMEVPEVAEAMYAHPATNLASMGRVLQAVVSCGDERELEGLVEEELAAVDARTVERFAALLAERGAA